MLETLKKNKYEKALKEHTPKVFNNVLSAKRSVGISYVKAIFENIKNQPKLVEYVLKNASRTSLESNAELVDEYLKKEFPVVLINHNETIKKEAENQIKKLKFSNLSKFWENFIKDIKSTKTNAFDLKNYDFTKIKNNIAYAKSDIIEDAKATIKKGHVLSIDDLADLVLYLSLFYETTITKSPMMIYKSDSPSSNEVINDIYTELNKIKTAHFSAGIATKTGDDLGIACAKYVEENRITFKLIIQKINKYLDAIGKLKFKNLMKK